ncbi:AraC-like DNA-binding protein/mannose-6-phosphate isomerase-like protein (cupin superfamily) [Paenibacillus castaneae]|uniref:AraC family transcriptional regulator n=1 Tax=Paenibacillus castaneae TaxID=474957 RepID=UPI000C9C351B|nr:AraC family transcriptional regulator [Paenibacillus castaneae]NIK78410.1 AraC-like DNA-binding protein/mannose-6-phosphate isomerase-like protein (cupin superfamily) [Paenibacillus castaneae]
MDQTTRHALKEDRMHGDNMFPLAAYWIDQEEAGAPVLDCHWHSEAEFFFVLEGEVLFQVDTDYFPVKAGEAVYIDGGDIHAGHALGDAGCSFCAIVFDTHLLASASYDAAQERCILPLQDKKRTFPRHIKPNTVWERTLLEHLQCILDTCSDQQRSGIEAAIKGRLYLMLHEIAEEGRFCNRSETSTADTTKIDRLKTAIVYMQQNFHRPIRIAEIADQIPMSEGQFCRFFKTMTRQTPIEYLNAYRIRQAAELLLQPERKISAVALDVGFDHISYFVKVFRKTMKCTPSQFRKKQLETVDRRP